MSEKFIEDTIREHYKDLDSGEWLVEKGKVKEAKMLKEAVKRIEALKKKRDYWHNWKNPDLEELYAKNNDLYEREKALEASKRVLKEKYGRVISHYKSMNEQFGKMIYEYNTLIEEVQSEET